MATGSFKQQNYPALSGGVDWQVRSDDRQYGLDGYLAGSIFKSSPSQRYTGSTGRLAFGKLGGEHWLTYSAYDFSTKNFFIDDLGYYSQPREHGGYSAITYKQDHANEPIRRYALTVQTEYRWNWDGNNTLNNLELEPSIEFRNFWQLSFDYIHDFPANDDANRGIIGLYLRPSTNSISATIRTDSRQMIEAALQTGYSHSAKGAQNIFAYLQATIRPTSWMEFTPAYTIVKTRSEEAWVTSPNKPYYYYVDGRYNLFGDRDIDEHDLSLRGTITFMKNLSLQFLTQIFLAKGRYVNYKTLIGRDNLPSYNFGSPDLDFNEKTLNANIVLRWEYLPGSTFYLVWTQGRHGYSGRYEQKFSQDVGDVFLLPMDNVILAKFSYWWSL